MIASRQRESRPRLCKLEANRSSATARRTTSPSSTEEAQSRVVFVSSDDRRRPAPRYRARETARARLLHGGPALLYSRIWRSFKPAACVSKRAGTVGSGKTVRSRRSVVPLYVENSPRIARGLATIDHYLGKELVMNVLV